MRVITARNVHQALPAGIELLQQIGYRRDSRNGKVLVAPCPVTTEYLRPMERVILWPERDANPFFHLYESLWMLQGRNDVLPLTRFAKSIADYSDDGITAHGAYGHRWRNRFGIDQLPIIAHTLKTKPDDRRCVLQMWDARLDLGGGGVDLPCNTMATFQRDSEGRLDLTMFCRSNDIIWGCYGANAVHFSILLEYMARWIGCPVGVYRQISVNYHAYLNTLEPLKDLAANPLEPTTPYDRVFQTQLWNEHNDVSMFNEDLRATMIDVDSKFNVGYQPRLAFLQMAHKLFYAHHLWRTAPKPERFTSSLLVLVTMDQSCDWVVAATEWIKRRRDAWERKLANE